MKFFLTPLFIFMLTFSGCLSGHDPLKTESNGIEKFDFSQIPDGIFLGRYQNSGIDYQVEVNIKMHQIICVKVISDEQEIFNKKCALCRANELIQHIVDRQIIEGVDGVSGATQTGKALLEAIKIALSPPYDPIDDGSSSCD